MLARWISSGSVRLTVLVWVLTLSINLGSGSELKVRVRLADGQITDEVLEADNEKDSISVEYKQADGTLITFVADFRQDVKIFRALILGELERGQSQYQALCFITRLNHNDIIPSESMARLRQKNPQAIRTAEEKRSTEMLSMDVAVNLTRTWQLSAHIHNMCSVAREAVYTCEADVKHWLERGVDGSMFESQAVEVPGLQSCGTVKDLWQPCSCSYNLRLEWFPCLLKYCRNRDVSGRGSPYKCGIKSCSKGYQFTYHVPHKQLCLWEEET
ncbi:out at first protein homolog [Xyrauchen texanus]|uniref:out at first protein homolog n=1 Tax=Xyrauchen texanus TaxID=154827 RepID=UPI002241ADEC|nr:out at first protein homolog [Xyrauchen texanus]